MRLSGVFVPMATPTVGRRDEIDSPGVKRLTHTLTDAGVDGLFPCGSIGEFSSLCQGARHTVIDTVVNAAGETPVLAGCGDTSLSAVVDHTEAAADAGADAAVVVTPYYLETTQRGLRTFYETVAGRAPLPVVLYNIPGLTAHHLSVDTVTDLAAHENIIGIKDTSGDMRYFQQLCTETPETFQVLQGATELSLAALDAGGDGLVAGPANVFPREVSELYAAYERGDRNRAVELMQTVVAPLVTATADVPTAAAMKHLLDCAGQKAGRPIPPLPTLTEQQRESLAEAYNTVLETTTVSKRT
jgi:4-hydroxy-tetrahydrodipicolinate synthase